VASPKSQVWFSKLRNSGSHEQSTEAGECIRRQQQDGQKFISKNEGFSETSYSTALGNRDHGDISSAHPGTNDSP
jgi:hypothetical protein